jgi:hypothetical protein
VKRWYIAAAAALLIGPACTSTDDEEEIYLPTEAEAQARADNTIDQANADAEFEKLQGEIQADEH